MCMIFENEYMSCNILSFNAVKMIKIAKIAAQTYLGGTYEGSNVNIVNSGSFNWKATYTIPSNYLEQGSNGAVIVIGTNDPYAPFDIYSRSYRYHIVNLEYGKFGTFH